MNDKTILVWFRNDLRIHDNEILWEATQKASTVIPVYCFDPRYFTKTNFGTLKTGNLRAKFLLESLTDLKQSLQNLGGDLLITKGDPAEIIPSVCRKYKVDEVYHHREVAAEETVISSNVEDELWKMQINLKHFIGHTMHHKEDLPFPIKDIPDAFAKFRKKVEREAEIRPSFDTPSRINIPANLENSTIPSLEELNLETPDFDPRSVLKFKGGETEGLKRLKYYLWDTDLLQHYKKNRNGLIGADYSTKFSPWLADGCLSPRAIYWEVKRYEKERGANDSTYWLIFELLWRDYFRFMFKKHGTNYFIKTESQESDPEQQALFNKWKNAETGIPFVDANMKELNITGFMSKTGRQNVASYLVNDLNINWTWGAAYFEEKLIDYSPASNWGNWAYIAGVGNDPKEILPCNIDKQASEYDPKGAYVELWLKQAKTTV